MTAATTRVERCGPAIQAALAKFAPEECAQFEAEYAQALNRAEAKGGLALAQAVLDRWWGIAAIRANPLSEQERTQVARAKTGDFTGLLARVEQLLENPHQPRSAYDEPTDQWTTVYGGGTGLIVYAVVHERQRVIILRLV